MLFTFAGLALIVLAGEVYLRLKVQKHFVQGVGYIWKPNVEISHSNVDFWVISHTNSLGFLDREPISSERAVASCHIAMIGDSFVEADEVPIADKFHVRLEDGHATSTGTSKATNGLPKPCSNISRKTRKFAPDPAAKKRPDISDGGAWLLCPPITNATLSLYQPVRAISNRKLPLYYTIH